MSINRRIPLNKPMNYRERDDRFSVVNAKWLDMDDVLFPVADIESELLSDTFNPRKLVSAGSVLFALGSDATYTISVNTVTTGSSFADTWRVGSNAGGSFRDAVYYNDGSDNFIYGLDSTGDVFKVLASSPYTFTDNVQEWGATGEQLMAYHPLKDSVYYLTDRKLYKQTQTAFSSALITLPANYTYKKMIPYRDFMIIIAERSGDIYAFFYDLLNEPTSIELPTVIGHGSYIAIGVVDGILTSMIVEPLNLNQKQYKGELIISQFNGATFTEANKLRVSENTGSVSESSSDGKYIYVGLPIDLSPLGMAGIYRIDATGNVRIVSTTADVTVGGAGFFDVLNHQGVIVTAYQDGSSVEKLGQVYDGESASYGDFTRPSVYVTPFMEDPYEEKDMTSVYMSFKTTFDESEVGTIKYRLSDRDSFTTILTYDYSVDGAKDRVMTIYNNSNNLPRFNEIQFKIESTSGLNITSAGYKIEAVDSDPE